MNTKRKRRDHDAPAVRPQTSVVVTDRSNKLHSSWHHWPLTSTENNHWSVPLSANKIQRPVLVWITVCFGLFCSLFLVCDLYLLQIYDFFIRLCVTIWNEEKIHRNDDVNRYDFLFFYLEIYSKCRPNISLKCIENFKYLRF